MNNQSKNKSNKGDLTLFLSGDVMTGRGIDQALPHSVDPILHESYVKNAVDYLTLAEQHSGNIPDSITYEYLWGDALKLLNNINPDVRIINLETAVTLSDQFDPNKRIHYRMHPDNTPLFAQADVDVCVLANNHMLDWGQKGLRQSLQVLKKHDIKTAGAGLNAEQASAPAIIQTATGRLLIFSYATADSGIPSSWQASAESPGINLLENLNHPVSQQVIKNIERFRKDEDWVVLSIHWGPNWGYNVPKSQQTFAHALIDAGIVDLVHGHSSHHPKPIEVYKEHLILYGCGDLINDYEGITGYEQYRDDLSLLYIPTLDPPGTLASLILIPIQRHKFRLSTPNDADKKWLMEQLNYECKSFGTSLETTDNGFFSLRW